MDNPADDWGGQFGAVLTRAGDINGDGYVDVVVGAPAQDDPDDDNGNVFVYFGASRGLPSAPNFTLRSPEPQLQAAFGSSIAASGDLNGDGLTDVAIGACCQDGSGVNAGAVFVFQGETSGALRLLQTLDNPTEESEGRFGSGVVIADTDGDGLADMLVGSSGQHAKRGTVYWFRGTTGGPTSEPDVEIESPIPAIQLHFGALLANAGDIDGDGFDDLIVGTAVRTPERLFVYLGSAAGPHTVPNQTILSPITATTNFGQTVTAGKDMNGDGYPDCIVGAYGHDDPATDIGRAYLYNGNARGLSETSSILESPAGGTRPQFGRSAG